MTCLVLKNFKTGKKLLTSANWTLRLYILKSVHFQHQVLITVWKKIKFPFQWCINQPLLRRKKIHLKTADISTSDATRVCLPLNFLSQIDSEQVYQISRFCHNLKYNSANWPHYKKLIFNDHMYVGQSLPSGTHRCII